MDISIPYIKIDLTKSQEIEVKENRFFFCPLHVSLPNATEYLLPYHKYKNSSYAVIPYMEIVIIDLDIESNPEFFNSEYTPIVTSFSENQISLKLPQFEEYNGETMSTEEFYAKNGTDDDPSELVYNGKIVQVAVPFRVYKRIGFRFVGIPGFKERIPINDIRVPLQ